MVCLSSSVQFDSNGDGQISLTELREAMKKLMGEQVTNREINEILRDVDLNGDGLVNFEGERRLRCAGEDPASFSFSHAFPRLRRVCAHDVPLTSTCHRTDREASRHRSDSTRACGEEGCVGSPEHKQTGCFLRKKRCQQMEEKKHIKSFRVFQIFFVYNVCPSAIYCL